MKIKIEIEVDYPKARGKRDVKEIRSGIKQWFKHVSNAAGYCGGLDALNAYGVAGDIHFKVKAKAGKKVVVSEKWTTEELDYRI